MAGVVAAAATRFQTTRSMVRTTWCLRVFGTKPTHTQARFVKVPSSLEEAKRGIDDLKEKAASSASYAVSQSKEAAGAAENIAEKAKQSAKEAWNATKDAAQKVQNTVAGKTEATAGTVKENIEAAKQSMNTKN